ncbi:hypothetical protein KGQ34_00205 [Patescibacteria group bacterium]|nr:hypothetical protein [Patescibacteria group bacterium]
MEFNTLFQSKKIKIALVVLGALIALLAAFKAGEFVGYRKARFSYQWEENYHRNFAGPGKGFFGNFLRGFGDRDFINSHGTFGAIIKIDGNTVIVKGKDEAEKIILVSASTTTIESRRETLQASDLKVDDQVVVIGSPNEQGQIEAKLIRVFR